MKEINQLWDEIIMPADEEPLCENHEEDDKGTELENINAIKVQLLFTSQKNLGQNKSQIVIMFHCAKATVLALPWSEFCVQRSKF